MFNKIMKIAGGVFCILACALLLLMLLGVFELNSEGEDIVWKTSTAGLLLFVAGVVGELSDDYAQFKHEQDVKHIYTRKILLDLDSKAMREGNIYEIDRDFAIKPIPGRTLLRFKRTSVPLNPWISSYITTMAQEGEIKEAMQKVAKAAVEYDPFFDERAYIKEKSNFKKDPPTDY